jgi:serine protease Do
MKNLRFGIFALGLTVAVGIAIAGLGAQERGPSTRARPASPDERSLRAGDLMMLDGRGAQLGVMVSDLDAKAGAGVKVDEVTHDSAAEKAGLKAGDVVVEFDGEHVRSARQFTRLVQETPDGRTVKIAVMRDGKRQTLDATPEARAFDWTANLRVEPPLAFEWRGEPGAMPGMMMSRGRLGVTVESLSPQLADYFGVKDGGALVSSVTKDSAAEQAGLKAGDVITSVNGGRVRDADSLSRKIGDAIGTELSIGIVRDKKETTLKATLSTGSGQAIESRRPDRPRASLRPGLRL